MGGRGGGSRTAANNAAPAATPTAPAAPAATPLETRIFDAYNKLAERPGQLVSLVRLRNELGDTPRDEVDRALKTLDRQRTIQLSPDPNRKAIPREGHEAAINVGGQPNHFISR